MFFRCQVCKTRGAEADQPQGTAIAGRDDFQVSINAYYGAGTERGDSEYEREFVLV